MEKEKDEMKKEIEEEKNEKKSEMDKVAVELTEAIERENQKMPTRPTFMLRWHAVWKQLLLFRTK